ncbi:transporter substrate-binding domain-containing protein [Brevibacillus sp. B_LB10_24]|uniref:transporter substrate-binding domain-containing protein n=1 Tax=Brevibacillus sp. B_LB10_24 TaxID=3380645 RepID=UPI0038B987B3
MKKALLILALFILVATGCSQAANTTVQQEQSTIQKVLERKKLIVGFGLGDMPFHMKNKKEEWIGYEVDLANAMAKALNVDLEFKQYDFSALIPALQNGNIDLIISALTIRGDRALAVSFSDPYYSTGQALLIPKTDNVTKSWQDLDKPGKVIAVSQGSTGALLTKEIMKHAEIKDFDDLTNAAMAVGQGRMDGLIFDETALRIYELMYPDNVKGIYDLISSENLGIAVKKNDLDSILWLNAFLSSYKNSPDDIASHNKWFESNEWLGEVPQTKQ